MCIRDSLQPHHENIFHNDNIVQVHVLTYDQNSKPNDHQNQRDLFQQHLFLNQHNDKMCIRDSHHMPEENGG